MSNILINKNVANKSNLSATSKINSQCEIKTILGNSEVTISKNSINLIVHP